MAEIIPNPTIRFKMKVKAAIPQKAKKDHFFHMNKNIVNTTLANPSNPYMYHIQDGTFGYVVIMDEFHSRYVNAVPALAINIKTNQNVNNLPRFLPSTFCDTEPSNVSGIIFFLKINLLICYRKWTRLSMNLFGLRIKKFSSPKIKIWFEPMFFFGFFCSFERCGSAAFPNFRWGNSSPPTAAKCVRTNSRILH